MWSLCFLFALLVETFCICVFLTSQLSVTQVLLVRFMSGAPHWPGGPAAVVTSVGSEYTPNYKKQRENTYTYTMRGMFKKKKKSCCAFLYV